jgi:hypothetical protein
LKSSLLPRSSIQRPSSRPPRSRLPPGFAVRDFAQEVRSAAWHEGFAEEAEALFREKVEPEVEKIEHAVEENSSYAEIGPQRHRLRAQKSEDEEEPTLREAHSEGHRSLRSHRARQAEERS